MRVRLGSSAMYRFAVAVWLCASGPAWAGGGGGADFATLQRLLGGICGSFSMPFCPGPQLPTITQAVLESAALVFARPESIRNSQNIPVGSVYANNPPPIPPVPLVPVTLPVSAADIAKLKLAPLAFVSAANNATPATPTQQYDPHADIFFSAVTTYGNVQGAPQPAVLNLFYEDLDRVAPAFVNHQAVALLSLPLVVLNKDGSERPVPTKLEIKSCADGLASCFTTNATGDFAGTGSPQTLNAQSIGLSFAVVFGPSPIYAVPHAFLEVQVPLVITNANDPAYFADIWSTTIGFAFSPQVSILGSLTFLNDDVGFPAPGFLGSNGQSIGIAPYPAPLSPVLFPKAPPTANFGFCANLPDNSNGPAATLRPAVAAFVAIATDGEAFASSPLPGSVVPPPTLQCPF